MPMQRPDPFDLADAAAGQPGRVSNALTCTSQCHNPFVCISVGFSAGIAASRFRQLNALALPFPSFLVVFAC